jgi:hypothetical protein
VAGLTHRAFPPRLLHGIRQGQAAVTPHKRLNIEKTPAKPSPASALALRFARGLRNPTSARSKLKRALLAAKSLPTRRWVERAASILRMLDRLGIAQEMKAKSILNAQAATRPAPKSSHAAKPNSAPVDQRNRVGAWRRTDRPRTGRTPGHDRPFGRNYHQHPGGRRRRCTVQICPPPAAASVIRAAGVEPGGLEGLIPWSLDLETA